MKVPGSREKGTHNSLAEVANFSKLRLAKREDGAALKMQPPVFRVLLRTAEGGGTEALTSALCSSVLCSDGDKTHNTRNPGTLNPKP